MSIERKSGQVRKPICGCFQVPSIHDPWQEPAQFQGGTCLQFACVTIADFAQRKGGTRFIDYLTLLLHF